MRISPGLVALGISAVFGGGYAAFGADDFAVEVHRPVADTYAAISAVHTFGSGLRHAGVDNAQVRVTRPSDREIVFTIPSSADSRGSRLAFTLSPLDGGRSTEVRAAIDVPPVPMPEDKRNRVLSEAKVEGKFRDAIRATAERLNAGQSVEQAQYDLTMILDVVALASNPEKAKAFKARVKTQEDLVERYNANPGRFNDEYVLVNESGGMVADTERQNAADEP
ncbi:MAG: hypothetical protein RL339_42 [Pseudomonadota bacterium]|jgi:hypothetical protein